MSQIRFEDINVLESRLDHFCSVPLDLSDENFRRQKLEEYEKTLVRLFEQSCLDPMLLEHLLQFGTVIRRTNSAELFGITSGVFECLAHESKGA